jgi:hypothetical protein
MTVAPQDPSPTQRARWPARLHDALDSCHEIDAQNAEKCLAVHPVPRRRPQGARRDDDLLDPGISIAPGLEEVICNEVSARGFLGKDLAAGPVSRPAGI